MPAAASLPPALILLAALVACRTPAPPVAQAPAPPDEQAPAAGDPRAPVAAAPLDPQALYGQCRERVEGPEADGECGVDADCARGGCSQEICATPAALADLMSTCEVLPCFQVLQDCGCNEGRCTWTVGAPSADPSAPPVVLPPRDQPPGAAAPSPAG